MQKKKLSLEMVQWLKRLGCKISSDTISYVDAWLLLNQLKSVMFYPTHHHGTGYEGWSCYGEIGIDYIGVEQIEPQKTIEEAIICAVDYIYKNQLIETQYKILNIK